MNWARPSTRISAFQSHPIHATPILFRDSTCRNIQIHRAKVTTFIPHAKLHGISVKWECLWRGNLWEAKQLIFIQISWGQRTKPRSSWTSSMRLVPMDALLVSWLQCLQILHYNLWKTNVSHVTCLACFFNYNNLESEIFLHGFQEQNVSLDKRKVKLCAVLTSGAGGQRSERPPGCPPSEGLWPASSQILSSWPTPSRGWGSAGGTHTQKET